MERERFPSVLQMFSTMETNASLHCLTQPTEVLASETAAVHWNL